jgi:proteasome lid subunit RPN8/RPN11
MRLHLPTELFRLIQRHGETSYPHEGAGVLLGKMHGEGIEVEDLMTMPNTFDEHQRHRRYMINAQGMMEAELAAEGLELEVVGIFHSHPDHPAQPSPYDLEHSLPWYAYLITCIEAGEARNSRAWRLQEDREAFKEIKLIIGQSEVEE